MQTGRKQEMEDKVLSSLTGCVKGLSGIDLVIKDRPDRKTDSRPPIENGCDAILSGLDRDIAVQIAEVPIVKQAYSESAKIKKLRQCLEPLLSAEYPDQGVDVDIHYDSLRELFDPEALAQEILSFVQIAGVNSMADRERYKRSTLSTGERIDVRRFVSSFPCPLVRCVLSESDGFRGSFRYVIEKKCRQFSLYEKDYLLCVVLWSEDFMHLNEELVIDAFRACEVDIGRVDSIWFVHQLSTPLVYPLYSQNVDSRNDAAYLQCYQWWPAPDESRPFKDIPHQFGSKPVAALSDS